MKLLKNEKKNIDLFSKKLIKKIIDTAFVAGSNSAHIGGALSLVEIISVLFGSLMKIDKNNPNFPNRDRFILSKGHGCLVYYCALANIGFIKEEELKTFEGSPSKLLGHPVKNKELGIDFSNGSLGMGLSLGIGVSIANIKLKKENKVYVVVGDGECNEGSVWEAAMSAAHFKLKNLIVIIDKNNFQQTGKNKDIMDLKNISRKWKSFGWIVEEIDGHNIEQIYEALTSNNKRNKPLAIIANTTKGHGISFAENDNAWHHNILSKTFYEKAITEINKL